MGPVHGRFTGGFPFQFSAVPAPPSRLVRCRGVALTTLLNHLGINVPKPGRRVGIGVVHSGPLRRTYLAGGAQPPYDNGITEGRM